MAIQDVKREMRDSFYPDEYIVEEDQRGNGGPQDWVLRYLGRILEWLYHEEKWMITLNRNFYHQAIENSEKLIVPDIAVFKGIPIPVEQQPYIVSWDMRKGDKACPPLVIEASSPSTYHGDIDADKKPRLYGLIGVKEYFAYDPNEQPLWSRSTGESRLMGWRYNEQGQPTPIRADEQGWMWSEVLGVWLKPDGLYLRMYDQNRQMLLTKDEAEEKARKAEESARIEAEQQIIELKRQLEELRRQQNKN